MVDSIKLPVGNRSTNFQNQINLLVKLASVLKNMSAILPFLDYDLEDYETTGLDIAELSSLVQNQQGGLAPDTDLIPVSGKPLVQTGQTGRVDATGTDVSVGVNVNVDGVNGGSSNDSEASQIWNSIDPEERRMVEGQDMLAKDKNGNPIYRVALAKDGKYHIYKKEEYSSYSYECVKKQREDINKLSTKTKREYNPETGRMEEVPNYKVMGGKGNGDGSNVDVDVEVEVDNDENAPDSENKTDGDNVKVKVKVKVGSEGGNGFYLDDGGDTWDPLVVDFNGDGKVDAQAGIGVDIDGDGKVDGAAVNGDKMLAMSDMNGNGTIDGTEVFGNKTVDPFTGKPINAKNGFEALKQIAISAEKETGVKCFDGKNVDLQKLQQCLATKGIKLGFVSDENNTEVEDLSKINKINVADYIDTHEEGDVQHNQQGSGTDEDGNKVRIDDIWFKIFR